MSSRFNKIKSFTLGFKQQIIFAKNIFVKFLGGQTSINQLARKTYLVFRDGGFIGVFRIGRNAGEADIACLDFSRVKRQTEEAIAILRSVVNDGRETILIVSHEASLTGAPVVALNLAKNFSTKYKIISILFGPGELEKSFSNYGPIIQLGYIGRDRPHFYNYVVTELKENLSIKAAFVNSTESSWILQILSLKFIPSITLIHEFADYVKPANRFYQILFWSTEIIFSSEMTKQSAIRLFPESFIKDLHVIPQGKCVIPTDNNPLLSTTKHDSLLDFLEKLNESKKLIIGAGTVEYRKGVDIFIQAASKIVREMKDEEIHFVWIGNGGGENENLGYTPFLYDQINRSQLSGRIILLPSSREIQRLLKRASIFLLTSRVDPLPNVAIDAMEVGLPLICFEQASGIAPLLSSKELHDYCVADYLDSDDLALKAIQLLQSPSLSSMVSNKIHDVYADIFEMKQYVERLELIMNCAIKRSNQEFLDYKTLLKHGEVELSDGFMQSGIAFTKENLLRWYIRSWSAELNRFQPNVEFWPEKFRASHSPTQSYEDPYAQYLRSKSETEDINLYN